MKISSEIIEKTRSFSLAAAGVSCFAYAGMALFQGRPDPFLWWIPGAFGLGAAVLITLATFIAGRAATDAAMDELYHSTAQRAAAIAYWVSLALFVITALLAKFGIADRATSTAILGTLMGGSYLALFVWLDWRAGR